MADAAELEAEKAAAALAGVGEVREGMTLGLGTGSTAAHVVRLLGEKVRAGLKVKCVPTSEATRLLAEQAGIPLTRFEEVELLDLTLDGADEFDPHLQLIKGGGGALLKEKIVATASDRVVILCDASKRVATLGAFPLPVEVARFGWQLVSGRLVELGGAPTLRMKERQPFVTDEGHYILDCAFGKIEKPHQLARSLDGMVGVVEHGLFVDIADAVIVAKGTAVEKIERTDLTGR